MSESKHPWPISVLEREWPKVKNAPFSFILCLLVGMVIGGIVIWFLFEQFIIPGKDATIQSIQQQLQAKPYTETPNIQPRSGRAAANFKLSITDCNFIQFTETRKTGLLIGLRIRNGGEPSIATDWELSIKLPSGILAHAYESVLNPNIEIRGQPISPPPIPLDSLLLTQKVESTAIEGNLMFFTDAEFQSVTNDAALFILSAADVWGNRFTNQLYVRELLKP